MTWTTTNMTHATRTLCRTETIASDELSCIWRALEQRALVAEHLAQHIYHCPDRLVRAVLAPRQQPDLARRRHRHQPAQAQSLLHAADEMGKQRQSRIGLGGGGLRKLVAGAKRHPHPREVARQPDRLGQMGVHLIEADKHGISTGLDASAGFGRAVEAIAQRHQRPRENITALWAPQTYGDIRLMAFQADDAKVRGEIDVEPGM